MRRLRRTWRRVVTEARWLRDRYWASELAGYFQGPDPIEPAEQPSALDWARERADRPYDWSEHEPHDWSWAREHEAEIRAMWAEPEFSVRESDLSDAERAAWAEIVACWRTP
ncbi:hypothetical protein OG216_09935 [Streptomycetaceae bacterium NBC_01309]